MTYSAAEMIRYNLDQLERHMIAQGWTRAQFQAAMRDKIERDKND